MPEIAELKKILEKEKLLAEIIGGTKLEKALAEYDKAFSDDDDYFAWKCLEFRCSALTNPNLTELFDHFSRGSDNWSKEDLRRKSLDLADLRAELGRVHAWLEAAGRHKAACGDKPRILRLARHLGLSDNELNLLTLTVIMKCDYQEMNVFTRSYSCNGESLKGILGLSSREIMLLLKPDSPLIRNGLLSIKDSYEDNLMRKDLLIAAEVLFALRGLPVESDSWDTYLKIHNTALGEVVSREPGFRIQQAARSELDEAEPSEETDWHPESEEPDYYAGFEPGAGAALALLRKQEEGIDRREPGPELEDEVSAEGLRPYLNDLDYLEDNFSWLMALVSLKKLEISDDAGYTLRQLKDQIRRMADLDQDATPEFNMLKLRGQIKVAKSTIKLRLSLTRRQNRPLPRLERLAKMLRLEEFEKNILLILVASSISTEFIKVTAINSSAPDIAELCFIFNDNLAGQVQARRYFYRRSPLIRFSLITLSGSFTSLSNTDVSIDRRLLDFLIGLDTEISEMVENSHLYLPRTGFKSVILPAQQKQLIIRTIEAYEPYLQLKKGLNNEDSPPGADGLVMLFHGPSGTGKTMTANAVANHLKKKLLLINFPSIGSGMEAESIIRLIFREAQINRAVLFFDECDLIFESRDNFNPGLTTLLTEIERFSGLIIMATNRPQVLDEAMRRRITYEIAFSNPDYQLREEIWRIHLPPKKQVKRSADVDIKSLAYKYELSGGLIKNALASALLEAVARDPGKVRLSQADLEKGARMQLKGSLAGAGLLERITPRNGLSGFIAPPEFIERLQEIVRFEKAKEKMINQWGFMEVSSGRGLGTCCLFHGPSGTGKTFAAEIIAFETGRRLQRVNTAELISKWVGETAKNINAVFQQAGHEEVLLVFEEADSLFAGRTAVSSASDRYANADVNYLLQRIENYPGMVILTTNLLKNLDHAMFRRFRYVVEFCRPDAELRRRIWRAMVPERLPLGADVDFARLAEWDMVPGHIWNAVIKAAARTVMRGNGESPVTQNDFMHACREEMAGRPQKAAPGFIQPGSLTLAENRDQAEAGL